MDVPEDLELENFKAFCEAESGMKATDMIILFNGSPLLDDKKSLKDYGVKNNDMLVMERIRKQPALSGGGKN